MTEAAQTKPLPNLITPRHENGDRVVMQVSAGDYGKVADKLRCRRDWEATVTDQITGKSYVLIGAECSLPHCYCDALIVREVK